MKEREKKQKLNGGMKRHDRKGKEKQSRGKCYQESTNFARYDFRKYGKIVNNGTKKYDKEDKKRLG